MNNQKDNLLLVFIKNPRKGKVKTRLAKTVGDQKALDVYRTLLSHTIKTAVSVKSRRQVWYSDFIDVQDDINEPEFEKYLQKGDNLGNRMNYAFNRGFKAGHQKIVIIGSDCPGITPQIIERAFHELESRQVVLGPSEDGGYYLLGMNRHCPEVFAGVSWSTDQVLAQTISNIESNNLSHTMLPVLNDIDTAEDLENSRFF